MTIIVTGGQGQVGWEIAQRDQAIQALSRNDLNITDTDAVEKVIKRYQPTLLINCAAYTAVDKAEQEPQQASAVNRDGAAMLAQVCAKFHIPLIHLSTDYVFDGKQHIAYHEEDTPAPLSHYGVSKWQGEQAVRDACEQHIILRISGVFGVHGNNFVKTILRLSGEKESLRIVADQTTCPTPAADIAEVVLKIAKKIIATPSTNLWGTYHYCGASATTWYQFATEIIELAKRFQPVKVQEILPITAEEYAAPAQRPAYSVLNCQKIAANFAIQQKNWQLGLAQAVQQLVGNNA